MSVRPGYHLMQVSVSPADMRILERLARERGHSHADLVKLGLQLLVEKVERENETNITRYRERQMSK